ncbi:MAG: archease [Acidobacteriota bacterium]|nr:archease [Acidobacteriota bacterium]
MGQQTSAGGGEGPRGHRVGPHTADCVIEAWGPDRTACLVEAMDALVQLFAEIDPSAAASRVVPVSAGPGADAEILVALLEEVICTADVLGSAPVRFHLVETEDGGVAGDMEIVDRRDVLLVGPVPKAVSYSGIEMGEEAGAWHCRAVVDV